MRRDLLAVIVALALLLAIGLGVQASVTGLYGVIAAPATPYTVTVEVCGQGVQTMVLDARRSFTLALAPGAYTVRVRGLNTLYRAAPIVVTAGQLACVNFGTLIAGDANGDNVVSIHDLSIMAAAYNNVQGDGRYDVRADFNLDGKVDVLDLGILASNYRRTGDGCS